MEQRYWFRAKRFGWGWYPASWQGFLIILAYVLFLGFVFTYGDERSRSVSDTLYKVAPWFVLATLILLVICLKTGERPRWNWGFSSSVRKENSLKKTR